MRMCSPKMHVFKAEVALLGKPMSPREKEALLWACRGLTNKEISTLMGASDNTVRCLLKQVFKKLGVTTRTAATICAIKEGWFTP
jgi:DNA-binding NarL/FixJ family response regulator